MDYIQVYHHCKRKKRDRIRNKIKKQQLKNHNFQSRYDKKYTKKLANHSRHFKKTKTILQKNIQYDAYADNKYEIFVKPKQFKSNTKAYRVGFKKSYKQGYYDGHIGIYDSTNLDECYSDNSYDVGKVKGYNAGYTHGENCDKCHNQYRFTAEQQNVIGLHWKSNNKQHVNIISLEWSDKYGYYSYNSFGWTLYTQLFKTDYIRGVEDIKTNVNDRIKIPIYTFKVRANRRKGRDIVSSHNIANRISIGAEPYIHSNKFMSWLTYTDGYNYEYNHGYNHGYYHTYHSYWDCTCNPIQHLCSHAEKALCKKLNFKYKSVCYDAIPTIIPDLTQTRKYIGHTMMYNTPLSKHGIDIVRIVLDFTFGTKVIDYCNQYRNNKKYVTKSNGDNFIVAFKILKDVSQHETLLKWVNIYGELKEYLCKNGDGYLRDYLYSKPVMEIIKNVNDFGTYNIEELYIYGLDGSYNYNDSYWPCGSYNYNDSYCPVNPYLVTFNEKQETKMDPLNREQNKVISLYVRKKFSNRHKKKNAFKVRKVKKEKWKRELNHRRWGEMRKHKNNTKNRFSLLYYL